MEPTTLTTDRLVLRPFRPADEEEVHAAAQDPDIQRWTQVPSPYERTHAHAFVNEIVPTGWREDTAYPFAVRLRAPDGADARDRWSRPSACTSTPRRAPRSATGR